MRIIKKGIMPNGTKIQIEDWSEDFNCFSRCGTVAAYPIAKASIQKSEKYNSIWGATYYPEVHRKFRASFNFECGIFAEQVFDKLISGENQLKDFAEYMDHPEYALCL